MLNILGFPSGPPIIGVTMMSTTTTPTTYFTPQYWKLLKFYLKSGNNFNEQRDLENLYLSELIVSYSVMGTTLFRITKKGEEYLSKAKEVITPENFNAADIQMLVFLLYAPEWVQDRNNLLEMWEFLGIVKKRFGTWIVTEQGEEFLENSHEKILVNLNIHLEEELNRILVNFVPEDKFAQILPKMAGKVATYVADLVGSNT